MTELKRILDKKILYVICLLIIVSSAYFVLSCIGNSGFKEFNRLNKEYVSALNNYENAQSYSDDNEDANNYIDYITSYQENNQAILENANRVKKFSALVSNAYTLKNINKTYNDYSKIQNVIPVITNTLGFDRYILFIPKLSAFVIFIMIYIMFNLHKEYDNGEILFSYSAKNGRFIFALKRNLIYIGIIFTLLTIFHLIIFLIASLLYGFVDLDAPIQSSMLFSNCVRPYSIIGFCVINIIVIAIGLSFIILFFNTLLNLIKNRYIALVIMLIIFFAEWRYSLVLQNNSIRRLIANINIYRIIDFSTYFRNYQNVKLFNQPVSSDIIMVFLVIALFIVIFFVSGIVYARRHPFSKIRFAKIKEFFELKRGKVFSKLGFTGLELYKIFFRNKKIVWVILAIIGELFLINMTQVNFPERQKKLDNIYSQYGGENLELFNSFLENFQQENGELIKQLEEIEVNTDNYEETLSKSMQLEAKTKENEKLMQEFNSILKYKDRIKTEYGVDTYIMSDRGYDEIIGNNSVIREVGITLALIIISVILASGYYLEERKSGVVKLLASSRLGLKKIYSKKLLIISSFILIYYLIITLIDIIFLNKMYGFKFLSAPVISITFMESKLNSLFLSMTIARYCLLVLALRLFFTIDALFITLIFSLKAKSEFYMPILIFVFGVAACIGLYANILLQVIMLICLIVILILCICYILRGMYGTKN
ncbi:hypothetical protein [Lachnospira pectinoschiza]|uniref:ABC-2 family transporter protein n=1 Tax=Lachnospira pectinoschiza TaxID=28052 RepID=A0A1G9WYQ3_9FIRM|nr:hypothetical protein [Lachnospira pectinoschiza]SDM89684.1 hypothetical protein SAMN05216544_1399 [Lachnospira pectinoschiza]